MQLLNPLLVTVKLKLFLVWHIDSEIWFRASNGEAYKPDHCSPCMVKTSQETRLEFATVCSEDQRHSLFCVQV